MFFLLTFCLLLSLSAVSNSFYLSIFFHSSPTISRSLLMQSLIAISIFLASISPPLSGHLSVSLLSFHPFSFISSLNSHDYPYLVVFRKPVSLLVPFMYAVGTHELSSFPLRLRDMVSSDYLQTAQTWANAGVVVL